MEISGFSYRLCHATLYWHWILHYGAKTLFFATESADLRWLCKHFTTLKCCISAHSRLSPLQNRWNYVNWGWKAMLVERARTLMLTIYFKLKKTKHHLSCWAVTIWCIVKGLKGLICLDTALGKQPACLVPVLDCCDLSSLSRVSMTADSSSLPPQTGKHTQ